MSCKNQGGLHSRSWLTVLVIAPHLRVEAGGGNDPPH